MRPGHRLPGRRGSRRLGGRRRAGEAQEEVRASKKARLFGLLSLQSPVKLFRDQGSARELDAQGLLQSVLQQAQVLADLKKSILKVRWLLSPEPPSLGRCALVLGAQRTLPETRPPSPGHRARSSEKVGFFGALGLEHGHLVGPCGSTAQVAQLEPGSQTDCLGHPPLGWNLETDAKQGPSDPTHSLQKRQPGSSIGSR